MGYNANSLAMKTFLALVIIGACAFSLWPLLQPSPPPTGAMVQAGTTTQAAPAPGTLVPTARKMFEAGDTRIDECSGLGASRRYPGAWWMHNDSGDEARLFLVGADGKTRATIQLQGALADDWEDMAIAADAGSAADKNARGAWVYAGDIGDNLEMRDHITIYRFREPSVPAQSTLTPVSVPCESLTLRYPVGARNAETLLANARGELMIVTKTTRASEFFITPKPFQNGTTQTLQSIGKYQFGESNDGRLRTRPRMTTGGDISPDGRRIVVCTYTQAHEWTLPDGDWKTLLKTQPQLFELPALKQSEAIAYGADGKGLFVSSEGVPCPLWQINP